MQTDGAPPTEAWAVDAAETELVGAGTLPAQIHDLLEEAIISGALEPGTRLHADRLATRYGVSRIPVREALRSLHEAGWVDIRPRYGAYVRERSEGELTALFEARSVIEASIARWAAQRRSEEDLASLRRVVAASREAAASGDRSALTGLSGRFYAVMRRAARNDVVAALSAGLEKRARFYFSMVAGDLGADWVDVHCHLVDLVEARDGDAAAAVSEHHVLDTGAAVARSLADERTWTGPA